VDRIQERSTWAKAARGVRALRASQARAHAARPAAPPPPSRPAAEGRSLLSGAASARPAALA